MIEVIIQSSAVGLFHSLGVALAPMPRKLQGTLGSTLDWAGLVDFEAPCMRGSLALSVPVEICKTLQFGAIQPHNTSDLLRELTNQLLGRIKNRLVHFGVTLRTGLPSIVDRPTLVRRTATAGMTLYPFRALRGEIAVTLHGSIEESALVYSSTMETPNEGDIILF
jgi:hypothetical protein